MAKNNWQGQELVEQIYGAHPIIELLKAKKRKIFAIYTTNPYPKAWSRINQFLGGRKVDLRIVTRPTLDKIAGCDEHMGVLALVSPFKFKSGFFSPKTHPRVLLLDGVQDVKNFGAILRSAHCSGFKGVIISRKNCAPITPATLKASAGLAEHLDIYNASTVNFALDQLKKAGYNLYMAVPNGGIDIRQIKISTPNCLVIGNEEKGIKPELFGKGNLVSLPQISPDISYNASVAAGILMFNFAFQQ